MSFKRGLLKAPGGGTKTHRARFPRSRQPGALGQPPPPRLRLRPPAGPADGRRGPQGGGDSKPFPPDRPAGR